MLIFALNLKEEKEMMDNFVNACEDLFYGKVENYIFDSNSEMAAVCKGKAMRYIKKWLKSNEISTKTFGDFLLKIFGECVEITFNKQLIVKYRRKLFFLTFPTVTYIPIMRLDGRNEIIHYGINNEGKNIFIDECVIFDSKKRPVFRYSDSLGYLYTQRIFGENLVAIIIYKNNLNDNGIKFLSEDCYSMQKEFIHDFLEYNFRKGSVSDFRKKVFSKDSICSFEGLEISLELLDRTEVYKTEDFGNIQKYILEDKKFTFEMTKSFWKYTDDNGVFSYDDSTKEIKAPIILNLEDIQEIEERIAELRKLNFI